MINLYTTSENYKLIQLYLDFLLDEYDIVKLFIIENESELFKINYSNSNTYIYIDFLNEDVLKLLTNINKNIYLFNIKKLSINNDLSYLYNYNIIIIDKSFLNINIIQKYREILYLPCQINNKLIFRLDKIYDIVVFNKNSLYTKNIFDKFDNKITDLSSIKNNKYKILFQHKILLLFNCDEEPIDEILCQYCIYNNVLIINDKNLSTYKDFLSNYVIDIQYNMLPKFLNYVLNNYNEIFYDIYGNFDIEYLKENIRNLSNTTISSITNINNIDNNDLGFIMIRHINNELTSKYWIESYNCIRKYYNNKIIIIDDNSNKDLINNNIKLINCEIIDSEFSGRGELLAYYYLYINKFFKKTVIIHDSVFINKYIQFNNYDDIKFLWHFTHDWDNELSEINLLDKIDNNKNIKDLYYKKDKWYGCFGLQSVIDYNFLERIVIKYNIFNLIQYIDNREKRMDLERIFALICFYENNNLINNISYYGIIHHYIHWGYTFDKYIYDKNNNNNIKHLDIVKVWSGR